MRKVKQKMIKDLLEMLHEANMANIDDPALGGKVNDLDPENASLFDLYGVLEEALVRLGAQEQLNAYIDIND